ncbi:unnamed protein product [Paramecium pentaurelia]|uniref:Transmembrane protein n=1 Tax=Paramecium pentaurelia TaxID=43138 RepID=A0A8S1T2F4_9CILI|nr:unnamed protein product [Paramecium pentaurelia]
MMEIKLIQMDAKIVNISVELDVLLAIVIQKLVQVVIAWIYFSFLYYCRNICGNGLVVTDPDGFYTKQYQIISPNEQCEDTFILPFKGFQNCKAKCQSFCIICDNSGLGCQACKNGYKKIDNLCYSISGDNIQQKVKNVMMGIQYFVMVVINYLLVALLLVQIAAWIFVMISRRFLFTQVFLLYDYYPDPKCNSQCQSFSIGGNVCQYGRVDFKILMIKQLLKTNNVMTVMSCLRMDVIYVYNLSLVSFVFIRINVLIQSKRLIQRKLIILFFRFNQAFKVKSDEISRKLTSLQNKFQSSWSIYRYYRQRFSKRSQNKKVKRQFSKSNYEKLFICFRLENPFILNYVFYQISGVFEKEFTLPHDIFQQILILQIFIMIINQQLPIFSLQIQIKHQSFHQSKEIFMLFKCIISKITLYIFNNEDNLRVVLNNHFQVLIDKLWQIKIKIFSVELTKIDQQINPFKLISCYHQKIDRQRLFQ